MVTINSLYDGAMTRMGQPQSSDPTFKVDEASLIDFGGNTMFQPMLKPKQDPANFKLYNSNVCVISSLHITQL